MTEKALFFMKKVFLICWILFIVWIWYLFSFLLDMSLLITTLFCLILLIATFIIYFKNNKLLSVTSELNNELKDDKSKEICSSDSSIENTNIENDDESEYKTTYGEDALQQQIIKKQNELQHTETRNGE